MAIKYAFNLRSYAPTTERILFYSLQDRTGLETVMLDTNNFQPLRQYFKEFQDSIGLSLKKINEKLGNRKAEHSFYWNSTQWDLPTRETYNKLLNLPRDTIFKIREYEDLRREYEDLRREYEDLRREYEDLRRVFNPSYGIYDVIDIPIINAGENTLHPTTKPLEVIEKLVGISSNDGFTILDPFMGSGTTAVAAKKLRRNFIGFEISQEYFNIIEKRLNKTFPLPIESIRSQQTKLEV